jgi:MSHA type pilus biogenesis protein MshL
LQLRLYNKKLLAIWFIINFSVQEVFMKSIKNIILSSSLLLLTLDLASCMTDTQSQQQDAQQASEQAQDQPLAESEVTPVVPTPPSVLPVRYQTASYLVDEDAQENIAVAEESKLKVGARITSTKGPQPLWDILKRLAALKGMNVSWASDVDQNVLVDVDINANDDFYEAVENMLRQVDYFHEMQGSTIIVKYKETRRFQIAMPFTKQTYTTGVGGNVLGNAEVSTNVDGTIELKSKDNEFDIWENIQANLDAIMEVWTIQQDFKASVNSAIDGEAPADGAEPAPQPAAPSSNGGSGHGFYMIDKPVGIITVTAPRILLEKVDDYITTLKKTLYQQVSIEAKIIEVQLRDASSIGINWSSVLKNFNLSGVAEFGTGGLLGQVYPFTYSNDEVLGKNTYSEDGTSYTHTQNPGQFVSKISMQAVGFDVFLNALNEEGDTKILSNPKISVMNGQPALITVGRNVTYIDSITADRSTGSGGGVDLITYTAETERILSGIGLALTATILGEDEIVMNLVPITSELQEPIEYRALGSDGGEIGLPIVNVREMSTTVKVKDGEMLVIGGLISDVNDTVGEFAPVLGDIPLLRYFFGYETKEHLKRELIILLRPRII